MLTKSELDNRLNSQLDNTEIKVAIIGCGRIAHAHVEAIAATPSARLVAVCDVNEAAAQSMAATYQVAAFTHHTALCERHTPDIAIICTPPALHAPIAGGCLWAGAHVLCEKPLGLSPAEVESMFAVARVNKRALMMAAKFRFVGAVQAARERIARGELGEIVFYRNTFAAPVAMGERMNAQPALSGGGVIMDNGPHAFDLAHLLIGQPLDLRVEILANQQGLAVEDGAVIRFRTARWKQLHGEILLSWSAHSPTPYFVEIAGTSGALAIGWSDYDKGAAFAGQMKHFVEVARGHAAPEVSPEDTLWNARVITECYQSAAPHR